MKELEKDTYDQWIAGVLNDFEMGDLLFNSKKYNGSIFYFIRAAKKAVKARIDNVGEGLVLFGEGSIAPYKLRYRDFLAMGMQKSNCVLSPPQM